MNKNLLASLLLSTVWASSVNKAASFLNNPEIDIMGRLNNATTIAPPKANIASLADWAPERRSIIQDAEIGAFRTNLNTAMKKASSEVKSKTVWADLSDLLKSSPDTLVEINTLIDKITPFQKDTQLASIKDLLSFLKASLLNQSLKLNVKDAPTSVNELGDDHIGKLLKVSDAVKDLESQLSTLKLLTKSSDEEGENEIKKTLDSIKTTANNYLKYARASHVTTIMNDFKDQTDDETLKNNWQLILSFKGRSLKPLLEVLPKDHDKDDSEDNKTAIKNLHAITKWDRDKFLEHQKSDTTKAEDKITKANLQKWFNILKEKLGLQAPSGEDKTTLGDSFNAFDEELSKKADFAKKKTELQKTVDEKLKGARDEEGLNSTFGALVDNQLLIDRGKIAAHETKLADFEEAYKNMTNLISRFKVSENFVKAFLSNVVIAKIDDNGAPIEGVQRELSEEEIKYYMKWLLGSETPSKEDITEQKKTEIRRIYTVISDKYAFQDLLPYLAKKFNADNADKLGETNPQWTTLQDFFKENIRGSCWLSMEDAEMLNINTYKSVNQATWDSMVYHGVLQTMNDYRDDHNEGIFNDLNTIFSQGLFKKVCYEVSSGGHWTALVVESDGQVSSIDSKSGKSPSYFIELLNKLEIKNQEGKKITFRPSDRSSGRIATNMQGDGDSCGFHSFINATAAAAFGGVEGVEIITDLIKHRHINSLDDFFKMCNEQDKARELRKKKALNPRPNFNQFMKKIRVDTMMLIAKQNVAPETPPKS